MVAVSGCGVAAGRSFFVRQEPALSKKISINVADLNRDRLQQAEPLDLPELDFLELTVLVEEKTEDGFCGDAGVSYLFRTDRGALLFDVGFGPERPALAHNAAKLQFNLDQVDALAISHLHPDHMGGLKASRDETGAFARGTGSTEREALFSAGSSRGRGL